MRDNGIGTVRNGARVSSTSDEGESDTPWEDKYKALTGKRLRLTTNDSVLMERSGKTREDIARERCEALQPESGAVKSTSVDLDKVGDVL